MTGRTKTLLAVLQTTGLLLLTGCPEASPSPHEEDSAPEADPELVAALQEALEDMVEESPATGLTAAIEFADGAVWVGAAGSTHPSGLDGSRAMLPDDLFNIASITKSFTGGLILTLVDEGLVELDDSFETWVPDGHSRGAEISVRHLLQHTAGVPEYTMTPSFQANYTASWTNQELLALVAEAELVNEPGAAPAYSNSHFVMLSMVAEVATDMPWSQALADRVLTPTGVDDTTMPGSADGWDGVVPSWLGEASFPVMMDPSGAGAAGGMVSDADDVAHWTRARFGGSFLSAQVRAAQVDDLMPLSGSASLGLGALVVEIPGQALEQGHNGALNGYVGWSGYRPDIDAAIALLGNAWGAGDPPQYSYPLGLHLDLWSQVDEHLAAAR